MGIKSRFCARCGKEVNKTLFGLCLDCYFKTHAIQFPKRIILKVCRNCGCVNLDTTWAKSELPLERHFELKILQKIQHPEEYTIKDVKILNFDEGLISAKAKLMDAVFEARERAILILKKAVCPDCRQKKSKKYSAKLQVRTNPTKTQEILHYLTKFSKKILMIKCLKRGADIYFTSRIIARPIAVELARKFNLKMSETSEAHGWNQSKNKPKYRSIILLKQRV